MGFLDKTKEAMDSSSILEKGKGLSDKTSDAGNSDSKKKEEDEEKTTGWDVFWIFVGIGAIVRIVRRVMEGQGW
jgi:hypothetical protein